MTQQNTGFHRDVSNCLKFYYSASQMDLLTISTQQNLSLLLTFNSFKVHSQMSIISYILSITKQERTVGQQHNLYQSPVINWFSCSP